MKLRILTTTLCMSVMGYSEVSLAATTSKEASSTKSCSSYCTNVKTDYISAVNEFYTEAISLYDVPGIPDDLKTQIAAATIPICQNNDYSSNTLKPFFENIINALPSTAEYAPFKKAFTSQMQAMESRVKKWKDPKNGPCKNLEECGDCDLGLPNSPCENTVYTCTSISSY